MCETPSCGTKARHRSSRFLLSSPALFDACGEATNTVSQRASWRALARWRQLAFGGRVARLAQLTDSRWTWIVRWNKSLPIRRTRQSIVRHGESSMNNSYVRLPMRCEFAAWFCIAEDRSHSVSNNRPRRFVRMCLSTATPTSKGIGQALAEEGVPMLRLYSVNPHSVHALLVEVSRLVCVRNFSKARACFLRAFAIIS